MGFTSWNTSDTKKSIASSYSNRPTFTVYMLTPGKVYKEENYCGYACFGGKNFFVELYEINVEVYGEKILKGRKLEDIDYEEKRKVGIDLFYDQTLDYKIHMPKLVENLKTALSMNFFDIPNPTDCEYQGYFYPECDLDEDEDDWC